MSVTVNAIDMARYKSVVFVGEDLYEGEERSFEDKAIASAARVALGNLGYDNESHISNDTILFILRNHCLRYSLGPPHFEPYHPRGVPNTRLGPAYTLDYVLKCASILQYVCRNHGKRYDAGKAQAAVILEHSGQRRVICAAMGTSFIEDARYLTDKRAIRDCHAEVLARRGLILFLLKEMLKAKKGIKCCVTMKSRFEYSLQRDVRFHLYVSKVPCGDADIPVGGHKAGHLRYRKSTGEGNLLHAPPEQGCLYKMSCSDKIALWNMVGAQGALLSHLLKERVFFDSIIVKGGDQGSSERAFFGRLAGIRPHEPRVVVLPNPPGAKVDGKSNEHAFCWVADDINGEYIDSKTGEQQGDTDVSKYNFFKLWMEIAQCEMSTYRDYKNGAKAYQDDKKKFQQFFSRNDLGKWYHKPQSADKFSI